MQITPFGTGYGATMLRALMQPATVEQFDAGVDYAMGGTVSPGYEPNNALSAYAAFPWVRACVDAISEDLAGLPRMVVVGEGEDAQEITDHPVLDLLENPSALAGGVNGEQLFQQRVMDWLLTGNAYRMITMLPGSDPVGLVRMHPARTEIRPAAWGGVQEYVFGDRLGQVPPEQVLHDRLKTWDEGPRTLYGTGLIRTLNDDLTADHNAAKMASRASANGRPTGLISPKDGKGQAGWTVDFIRRLRSKFVESMRDGSGVLFIGGELSYTSLGWSPRDMEFKDQRELSRHATLAAFGVPPTRVGLQSANYATAQMESQHYWTTLVAKARQLDAVDTRLARMFRHPQQARVRVVTDFSGVMALQESRNERVQRVQSLHVIGVPLAVALEAEGFGDLAALLPAEAVAQEPVQEVQATGTDGARIFVLAGGKGLDLFSREQETEETRAADWRSYIAKQHGPAEKAMIEAVAPALKSVGQAIAKKAEALLETTEKSYTEDEVGDLLDLAAELAGMGDPDVTAAVRRALETGFAKALAETGLELGWNASATTDILVGQMITNMLPLTKYRVRQAINKALEEGTSPKVLRETLEADYAFSPARAATVARTETTGAVERGQSEAYDAAKEAGLEFRLEWLTARDGEVRDSHIPMDGKLADAEGLFTSGAGNQTTAPGAFRVPEEDINCRCTRRARFEDDE